MAAEQRGLGGFRGLDDRGCGPGTVVDLVSNGRFVGSGNRPGLEDLERAILATATGEPELVIVDARVLRLLMGDLAQLIILKPVTIGASSLAIGEEEFVWDQDPLCP